MQQKARTNSSMIAQRPASIPFLFILNIVILSFLPDYSISWGKENSRNMTLSARATDEYRDNITRFPDSLKLDDFRANIFVTAGYDNRLFKRGHWGLLYEFQHHQYFENQEYSRQDHLLRVFFRHPLTENLKIYCSDEYRLRSYTSLNAFNYQRNIFNIYLTMAAPYVQQLAIGYQNWTKSYPNSPDFRNYTSNRIYIKSRQSLNRKTFLGIKLELQMHRGNLYPLSTAPAQILNVSGNRLVMDTIFDRLLNPKFLATFSYRFEGDVASQPNFQQAGEYIGDENSEELLAEDSDFGYLKNQFALSFVLKPVTRISLLTFYVVQFKHFSYWRIYQDGPKRRDRMVFLSNVLKFNLSKNLGLELQYNYENNQTNLGFYKFKMNSLLAGIYFQR